MANTIQSLRVPDLGASKSREPVGTGARSGFLDALQGCRDARRFRRGCAFGHDRRGKGRPGIRDDGSGAQQNRAGLSNRLADEFLIRECARRDPDKSLQREARKVKEAKEVKDKTELANLWRRDCSVPMLP